MSDALLFAPACRYDDLTGALSTLSEWMPATQAKDGNRNVHRLCVWLRGGLNFWAHGVHDANSEREANPVYRHIGRKEGPTRARSAVTMLVPVARPGGGGSSRKKAAAATMAATDEEDAARIRYLGDPTLLAQRCAAPASTSATRCGKI